MTHTSFMVLLMSLGACHVHSVHLTKEIVLAPQAGITPQAAAFAKVLTDFLKPAQTLTTNMATALSSSDRPQVSDILDIVNSGLGDKVLVIDDDAVRLDAKEFETALTRGAQHASRMLYPQDNFKQLATYTLMQKKVKDLSGQIAGAFAVAKVPLRHFEEILGIGHSLSKREIQRKDLFDDLFSQVVGSVGSTICNTVVSQIQLVFNQTLTGLITDLSSISVDLGNNILASILASGVELVSSIIEQGLTWANEVLQNDVTNICVDIINITTETTSDDSAARKRREVVEAMPKISGLQRDVDSIESALRGLLSQFVNPILKVIVSSPFDMLEDYADDAIDSIFPPLFIF